MVNHYIFNSVYPIFNNLLRFGNLFKIIIFQIFINLVVATANILINLLRFGFSYRLTLFKEIEIWFRRWLLLMGCALSITGSLRAKVISIYVICFVNFFETMLADVVNG